MDARVKQTPDLWHMSRANSRTSQDNLRSDSSSSAGGLGSSLDDEGSSAGGLGSDERSFSAGGLPEDEGSSTDASSANVPGAEDTCADSLLPLAACISSAEWLLELGPSASAGTRAKGLVADTPTPLHPYSIHWGSSRLCVCGVLWWGWGGMDCTMLPYHY